MKVHRILSLFIAISILQGCASTGDDPYCLKIDTSGQPTTIYFKGSKAQMKRFERNSDRGYFFKQ